MSTWTCGLATRLQTTPLFPHARLLHGGVAPTRPTTKTHQLNSTSVRTLENLKCDQQSERTGFGTTTSTTANLGFDAQESRRGYRLLMVPLSTSFVTVGQWERRHLATAPTTRTSTSIAICHILVTSPTSELPHGPPGMYWPLRITPSSVGMRISRKRASAHSCL